MNGWAASFAQQRNYTRKLWSEKGVLELSAIIMFPSQCILAFISTFFNVFLYDFFHPEIP